VLAERSETPSTRAICGPVRPAENRTSQDRPRRRTAPRRPGICWRRSRVWARPHARGRWAGEPPALAALAPRGREARRWRPRTRPAYEACSGFPRARLR